MTKREQMLECSDDLENVMIKIVTSHSNSFYAETMWRLCKAVKLLLDAALEGKQHDD